jgi:hypothetical protein
MNQIFEWLDLIRRGYKFKIDLGIGKGWDDMYEGYLIVFYHRPQLHWLAPPVKPEIISTDEIPF